MKSNLELLDMYKEEKALVIGGPESRTGLEPYPSFSEWKDEYVREYNRTHDVENPLSMEEAVALADVELAADELAEEDELLPEEDLKALAASEPDPETEEEDEDMNQTATTDMTPATKPTPTPAAVKAKPAAKAKPATVKKPAAVKAKPAAVKKPTVKKAGPNKTAEATKVFNRMYPKVLEGKKARKDVINELITKVGLTSNGASTYYQKLKANYGG